ncbi:MAG: beta-N-acetylhexosaminidase [Ferruginibacter sp.]
MKKLFLGCLLFVCYTVQAQELNVVPMPAEVELKAGFLPLKQKISIHYINGKVPENITQSFKKMLSTRYKVIFKEKITGKEESSTIYIELKKDFKSEEYKIYIGDRDITISGNENGIFYAFQTLGQMIMVDKDRSLKIRMGTIKDYPRFTYRGMHLDAGRHFFPVSYIKKYIDYLAFHKFNNFHWHLTEDQGWRIEIMKYPKLTEVGSCRAQTLSGRYGSDKYDGKKYCGFYTQAEIRDVVKYATDRFINVIPEIDIPGHTLAALASYPYLGCTKGPYKVMETWGVQPDILCAGNDSTYTFVQNVLDEVMDLFPSKYIHIGGDEAPKERWETCPVCQKKMKNENLKDEHNLQSYFIQRVEKYVNSKGRQIIGWDEILEGGLAPNATVMSWRGVKGGIAAAKQNHFAIMTPETPLYLNHTQTKNEDSITQGGYNPLELVYNYEPVAAELTKEEEKYILGAQGNMWSEYISNWGKLEYMLFPRMSALSEVVWSPKQKRNWKDFERRLPVLFELYKLWGAGYSNAFYDLQPSVIQSDKGIAWKLETKNKNGKIIYLTGRENSATFDYTSPLPVKRSVTLGAALTAADHTIISSWVWQEFILNKASGKKITVTTKPNTSYSGSGAFTLVDGVQNKMGMVRSAQFLGFNGNDLEAIIDLDSLQEIKEIILHAFEQTGSWIYRPASVAFYSSVDGKDFKLIGEIVSGTGSKNLLYTINTSTTCRYIKVFAKNYGVIPAGKQGAGNKSWLFSDEIEIN